MKHKAIKGGGLRAPVPSYRIPTPKPGEFKPYFRSLDTPAPIKSDFVPPVYHSSTPKKPTPPPDPPKQKAAKPPIGIEPEWVWKKCRMIALADAIKRYADANLPISTKWIEEYNELVKQLRTIN